MRSATPTRCRSRTLARPPEPLRRASAWGVTRTASAWPQEPRRSPSARSWRGLRPTALDAYLKAIESNDKLAPNTKRLKAHYVRKAVRELKAESETVSAIDDRAIARMLDQVGSRAELALRRALIAERSGLKRFDPSA
jgi:hypothetical protein